MLISENNLKDEVKAKIEAEIKNHLNEESEFVLFGQLVDGELINIKTQPSKIE